MGVTATLKNYEGFDECYVGEIYSDTRGRFPDGTLVTTSKVLKVEGGLLYTKNSIYKLEEQKE